MIYLVYRMNAIYLFLFVVLYCLLRRHYSLMKIMLLIEMRWEFEEISHSKMLLLLYIHCKAGWIQINDLKNTFFD